MGNLLMALSIEQARLAIEQRFGGGNMTTTYDHTDTNGNYVIQVYEVVDNGDGTTHTATYDWFYVDPQTCDYVSEFNAFNGTIDPNTIARVVVLDAGHGGSDPGSLGSDVHESAASLLTTNELKAYLESHYLVKILMTRTDNKTYPSLHDRAQLAIDNHAEAIVSVHYNHFDGTAYGYEDIIQENETLVAKQESIDLQAAIHAKMVPVLQKYGIRDRGMKRQDLQVLRDSYNQCRGILMEGLFLDNADDAETFLNAEWHKDYVAAIAQGLAENLGLPLLNPATADFQVYSKSGALIGQYESIDQASAAVKNFYNGGNVDGLEVKMVQPRPVPKTSFQKVIDFKGKVNGDGDNDRTIWFTGSYTGDQPPENLASQVNSGYAGIGIKSDSQFLSYSITGAPVGRQIQFEFDFGLFSIGDRQFLADNLDKLTFTVNPKAGCKYYIKLWNPVTKTYKTLHTDTAGNLGEKAVAVLKSEDIMQYVSPTGFVRFNLISATKTTDTAGVTVDFDYAKLTVDYSM